MVLLHAGADPYSAPAWSARRCAMKRNQNGLLALLCSLALASTAASAQGAPQIVWEVPTQA